MGGSNLVAVILLVALPSIWAPGPRATKKGNEAFRKAQYDKALEQYYKAMQIQPGDRALSYNAGTALLKQEKYDDALKSLMAGSSDPRKEIRTPSLYNSGNALYASQKYPEAVSAYREAVLSDANDLDAKFNYELAQYRLKKQQQENEKNKDKNQDKNQDQKDKKDQNQNQDQKENEQQKDSEEQNQQPEDEQKPQQGQDQKPNQQPEEQEQDAKPEEGEARPASLLSKQEAERLLDALKANEMEMVKARLKSKRKKNVDKDW